MAELLGHRMIDVGEDELYSYDWSSKLGSDVIVESSWEIEPDDSPAPLLDDGTRDDTTTSVTVSGLLFGVVYQLKNTVVTDAGSTLVQSFTLRGARR